MTLCYTTVKMLSALLLATFIMPVSPADADEIREKQWHLGRLNVAEAHRITRGAGVVVAVIDTGVWAGHPDMAGAVLPGLDPQPTPLGDGRDDQDGHGSLVAALIAARGREGSRGVLGIAPESKILPIRKVLNAYTTSTDTVAGIRFAIEQGAQVINMSFSAADNQTFHNAVREAEAANIVLIAGTGNYGAGGDGFPAAYPEVLAVGATDNQGSVAKLSVTGPQVDLVAPGTDILSINRSGSSGYSVGDGTSSAAAIVSGAAALIRARYPDMSAAEVVHRLTATAKDISPPGRDNASGAGELDLIAALTADVPPPTVPVASPTGASPAVAAPRTDHASTQLTRATIIGGAAVLVLGILVGAVVFVRRSPRPAAPAYSRGSITAAPDPREEGAEPGDSGPAGPRTYS